MASGVQISAAMMRCIFVLVAASGLASLAFGGPGNAQDEQTNVNRRYTVESVHVAGKKTSRLKAATRREIESVVGQKLDNSMLDRLASRIKNELKVERVEIRVAKGTIPEYVAVEFLPGGPRRRDVDADIAKGTYHSRQGWSGAVDISASLGEHNEVSFGAVSDGDALVERFAGIRARYQRNSLGTDRLRFSFSAEDYHEQWNGATLRAAANDPLQRGTYRTRQNFQPAITIVLAQPLTLTVGVSLERLEPQVTAARTDSSNSVINTLRYHRRWEDGGSNTHELDAAYSLRAATSFLSSDFEYTRNAVNVAYRLRRGRHTMSADFLAGRIGGRAPLYERFVLGNGSTLRGYSKDDIDPLGGDRVVHGSMDYGYRGFQVFYDTGAVWASGSSPDKKQSVGAGFGRAGKEGFLLAVAFPLRSGHVDPIFLVGFNF
jgi:hemolysin activation/secretion protein